MDQGNEPVKDGQGARTGAGGAVGARGLQPLSAAAFGLSFFFTYNFFFLLAN